MPAKTAKRMLHVGDTVVYRDLGHVYTAKVRAFEDSRNVSLHELTDVKTGKTESWGALTAISKLAFPDTPRGQEWLNPPAHIVMGTVVQAHYPPREAHKTYGGVADGDLAVVIQDKGDRVNVAKLGGSGRDAYARLPHSYFTVVKGEFVTE